MMKYVNLMRNDAYEVLRNASLFLDLMHEMTKEID